MEGYRYSLYDDTSYKQESIRQYELAKRNDQEFFRAHFGQIGATPMPNPEPKNNNQLLLLLEDV